MRYPMRKCKEICVKKESGDISEKVMSSLLLLNGG